MFSEGAKVEAEDGALWAEMQACMKFAIDPSVMFAKDRFERMMIVGASIADNAINSMRSFDKAHENDK